MTGHRQSVTQRAHTGGDGPPPLRSDLSGIGEQRQLRLAGITVAGRRRRPSGEKPPLPRELHLSGKIWLGTAVVVVLVWASLFTFPATTDFWFRVDHAILRWLADLRSDSATVTMEAIHALGSFWAIRPLRWATLLILIAFRRWRFVFGALTAFVVVDAVVRALAEQLGRPRPFVEIIGEWSGYSHPSRPVAVVAVTLVVMGLALVPKGRVRSVFFAVAAAIVMLHATSLVYLGTDHPTDVVVGALFAPAVGVLVFRIFVPEDMFPVSYRRGRTAHLDVTGRRAQALTTALRDQLGLVVETIEPHGLAGSGGSTPLRIKCAGEEAPYVFAKLYARSHLRADRWYKIARTILYGPLEDEARFSSVRQLVEYEDYILLKLENAGLPSPRTFGFVEITPAREYAIVTEFLEGAEEMSEVEMTDAIIDEALEIVRKLWDAGMAHRDIKPANVMVQDGRVVLIDPAFATIRPSPWRQAVDLANMMIILALRSSPEYVYQRALHYFSADDIAEAFAATKGVTIPTQSRTALATLRRSEGIDLVARFRDLSPHRENISIQRWTLRRVGLTIAAVIGALALLDLILTNIESGVL